MALETFAPTTSPNVGFGFRQQARVLSAAFGDGYTQRTPSGLNHMPRAYQLEWNPCTPEVADYITSFLEARQGVTPFFWTPPREITPRKFVCGEWERRTVQWNADMIQASFVEDFSLEV